uniref:Transmembrane protein 53 n=1 Tax=Steinernema glaseri TaxID=37863 RepID=A0A1I7ZEU4_9BILA
MESNGTVATGDSIIETVDSNTHAPLVVLFGWAGCQETYLKKYSEIYKDQKYSVIRFTAPMSRVTTFASYRAIALEVYEKNFEDYEPSRPIVFHLFSMNGCSLFAALWDLLETVSNGADIKKQTRGIIFDSSPANVLPWQGANAVSVATLPPSNYGAFLRQTFRVFLATVFSLHRLTIWLRSQWESNVYEHNFSYFRLRSMDDLPCRQLFLYSKNDEICAAESIEEFIACSVQKHPSTTESKCWFNSPHCQHLRSHRDEYCQLCRRFASDCFRESQ